MLILASAIAGLAFRWRVGALLTALALGLAADLLIFGTTWLLTYPWLDGPLALVGFIGTSAVASAGARFKRAWAKL